MLQVRTKAQSTLEYVILFGFVAAAILAMGVYIKRGTEGKLRESADQIGDQYEAGKTTGTYNVETKLQQNELLETTGVVTTTITTNSQEKSGSERVVALPVIP